YYGAITAIHSFFWHSFCDYYLEDVKHRVYQPETFSAESKKAAQYTLREGLQTTLKLLAPFAPFVTEEIYLNLGFANAEKEKSIHSSPWPTNEEGYINEEAENNCTLLHSILSKVRKHKAEKGLALNEELSSIDITLFEQEAQKIPLIEEDLKATGKIKSVNVKIGKTEEVQVNA
ncbi:MAG: class I tRNA ligase family protein, partial [Candidatus Micrarchaeia archaeon]